MCLVVFFFFKQKTAYEMRISDWSSDVCSSDLEHIGFGHCEAGTLPGQKGNRSGRVADERRAALRPALHSDLADPVDVDCPGLFHRRQIGRASCRERVCQYV